MPPNRPSPVAWITVEGLIVLAILGVLLLVVICLLLYAAGRVWHAGPAFKIVILLITATLTVAIVWRLEHNRRAESNMTRLLAGDTTVSLASFETPRGPRHVRCTDPRVLGYLTRCIRSHSKEGGAGGRTMGASFGFTDGTVFHTVIYTSPGRFALSLPANALEPGFPTHDVQLAAPTPRSVGALFRFIGSNIDEVRQLTRPTFESETDDTAPATRPSASP